MAWTVDWQVFIDGIDRSGAMRPYLLEIDVSDKEGLASDTATLTFDDSDGQLHLPRQGAAVAITLNGVSVFRGVVDKVRSTGTRGGGRILRVSAKGFDTRGKAKEIQAFHADDATLQEFLDEAGANAGFTVKLDPALAEIRRDYWSADNESFLSLCERLAREVNGTFKLRGNEAVLVKRGATEITAVIGRIGPGGNVINWDIAPFNGRGAYKRAEVRWFDRAEAKFKSVEVDIDAADDAPDATNIVRMPSGDEDQARLRAEGRKSEAEREAGEGSVELDIAPEAQAEAPFTLIGARPGVDGTYRIVTVTHKASRAGGATTRIELKQPGDGAGKDDREAE